MDVKYSLPLGSHEVNIPKNAKIIYLDQNMWIEISKFKEGKQSSCSKETFEQIKKASESGNAIFPISIIHLLENADADKKCSRTDLSQIMFDIAQRYTFQYAINEIISFEIINFVLTNLNKPQLDIRHKSIGKGVLNLIGHSPAITSETLSTDQLEEVKQKILKELDKPQVIADVLANRYRKKLDVKAKDALEEIEKTRQAIKRIENYKKRRIIHFWLNIEQTILPILAPLCDKLGLTELPVLNKKAGKACVDDFLVRLPTAFCYFTLLFEIGEPFSRKININDLYDVWHLSTGIPYCDIVVTEKEWASTVKRVKLDENCNTIVLSSITELQTELERISKENAG